MFMTKDVVERVGAFNESFGLYGYEHTEYSIRCKMEGLAPHHNVCPDGAEDYIYSMDLDSWMSFDFQHLPTLPSDKMTEATNVSRKVFEETIKNPIIYLPL
jgi:GT2 family glycosyltransferase